ncbi:hypothetical protein EV127DRAFT_464017 [Xylaria flabelliformis]|nr:hypothetical protein EV127DRAFT_464017 [Xylaria flabelliformis]
MPLLSYIAQRAFNSNSSSSKFFKQLANPSDVFSVLLILGGDVVARALAQLAGSRITPVAFSFGWVSYAVMAVVHAFSENKLMPAADCACKVINGHNGFVRDNSSWVIGRIMRDFETWKDDHIPAKRPIQTHIGELLEHEKNSRKTIEQSNKAGLRISIYKAGKAQLAIPYVLYGHWAILAVTAAGIILSFATGALPQWTREKWACRRNTAKTVILTRGNGSQHAIVILGTGNGLDLEDLAAAGSMSFPPSCLIRCATLILAALWILLLITAAGIQENTWYLLAIGSIGMLDNIYVAGASRSPKDFGIPLQFVEVIGHNKGMKALLEVESRYPRVGRSMLRTFFPGDLEPEEQAEWDKYSKLMNE